MDAQSERAELAAPVTRQTCSWCLQVSVGELIVKTGRVGKGGRLQTPVCAPACTQCAARLKERYGL